jgi:coproporphyrinogen III oxidase-like Fe-S oxidoreductase
MTTENFSFFYKFFSDVTNSEITNEALRYYLALNSAYKIENNHMPLPVWRRKGFLDQGQSAWERIKDINEKTSQHTPVSIYIHVPFCPSRCSFCDCLTMQIRHHIERTLDAYLDALLKEIAAWRVCGNLSERPITTVHFGGGTPLFLGTKRFSQLTNSLRTAFFITESTEWAIETTSASLNDNNFNILNDLGFTRLHLGVQSMEDHIRPLLKRRENSEQILEKIHQANDLGWITSVDLLVGLPKETISGFLRGIENLIQAETAGFSIYEINLSSQNRNFADQYHLYERDRRLNYFLFLAAVIKLKNEGYKKNLFNHFAKESDKNLYFTFPTRSEDCLAMGAYADGVFQDYHYRHLNYRGIIDGTTTEVPALEGGIEKPNKDKLLYPVEIAILSGKFNRHDVEKIFSPAATQKLIHSWEAALLIESYDGENFNLSPNGAWFSGNMLSDLATVGNHES